jgi:hypothetical protein
MAAVVAGCSQDFEPRIDIQPADTSGPRRDWSSETQTASALDSSDRNNRVSSCASRLRIYPNTYQTDHKTPVISEPLSVRGERDKGKRPTLPISPLPAIGSSITTVIVFEILRARRAAKMGLTPPQLSSSQNMLAILPSLLLGLGVAIFLSVLEVSLRWGFQ